MSKEREPEHSLDAGLHRPPRVAIVYESMFGNTRHVAEAIAQGMSEAATVDVTPVHGLAPGSLDCDVVIVGAPTHVHSLSRASTRAEAVRWSEDPARHLDLDESAAGRGVREWLEESSPEVALFAAFDTRADMPKIFTGSAAAVIERKLRGHGVKRLTHPQSFVVDKENRLEEGELDRARDWGRELGEMLAPLGARSEA